jgi:hypothetical protein
MRSWIASGTVAGLAAVIILASAAPARANYFGNVANSFLTGLNSVVTAPADPVMSVVSPLEEFEELPAGAVTGRIVGVFQGALLFTYRVCMGTLDMAFSPFPFKTLSPEPRYELVPGFDYNG